MFYYFFKLLRIFCFPIEKNQRKILASYFCSALSNNHYEFYDEQSILTVASNIQICLCLSIFLSNQFIAQAILSLLIMVEIIRSDQVSILFLSQFRFVWIMRKKMITGTLKIVLRRRITIL